MSNFIYIDPDNIGYTAGDADVLESMNFGNLFPGSSNIQKLRLGNVNTSETAFVVSGSTVNSGVIDHFSISNDGDSYSPISSGVIISLLPNRISDDIYIKYDVPTDVQVNEGTIRIITDEYSGVI